MRKFDSSLVHFLMSDSLCPSKGISFYLCFEKAGTMHYHIYCKTKAFGINYQEALSEFSKRLSAYCDISLHLDNRLQFSKGIKPGNHQFFQVVSGPSTYSSEEFAKKISMLQQSGKSNIHILVGFTGNECVEAFSILSDCGFPDSFSLTKCSLPAETLTLLLCEQLYRGYTILQGKTYHK